MLYLVRYYEEPKDMDTYYYMFETHTESVLKVNSKDLIQLITEYGMEAKNVYIKNNEIQIKKWPHNIIQYTEKEKKRSLEYILLSKVTEKSFKMFRFTGETVQITDNYLKKIIQDGRVANCDYIEDKEIIYSSIDTYETKIDSDFERYIAKKYEEFIAKTLLLGMDISFNYVIENEDVKLKKYTGNSYKVVIPSFITTICPEVFQYEGLSELILNNGLKYIGSRAFQGNSIKYIDIPKTVEIICHDAFKSNGAINDTKEIYTKLNSKTIII